MLYFNSILGQNNHFSFVNSTISHVSNTQPISYSIPHSIPLLSTDSCNHKLWMASRVLDACHSQRGIVGVSTTGI